MNTKKGVCFIFLIADETYAQWPDLNGDYLPINVNVFLGLSGDFSFTKENF